MNIEHRSYSSFKYEISYIFLYFLVPVRTSYEINKIFLKSNSLSNLNHSKNSNLKFFLILNNLYTFEILTNFVAILVFIAYKNIL